MCSGDGSVRARYRPVMFDQCGSCLSWAQLIPPVFLVSVLIDGRYQLAYCPDWHRTTHLAILGSCGYRLKAAIVAYSQPSMDVVSLFGHHSPGCSLVAHSITSLPPIR
jgi:hypothetical protein